MIYFLKHFKGIAYFLAMLILFQSCIAYHKTSSTIEEASSERDVPVKITTKNDNEYELNWIDVKEGNVESIKNTKRVFIDKNEITQILPDGVSLEFALNHKIAVQIKTKNHTYNFIKIEEQDDQIVGLTKVKGHVDTLSVVIPIEQIEKIQLKDKGKSQGRTAGLIVGVVGGALTVIAIVYLINFEISLDGWGE